MKRTKYILYVIFVFISHVAFSYTIPSDFQLGLGSRDACALVDGKVICWGTEFNATGYIRKPLSLPPMKTLTAGWGHICGTDYSDNIFCWGDNLSNEAAVPKGLTGVTMLSLGYDHSCGLTPEGVKCWSRGEFMKDVPKDLGQVKSLVAGLNNTCALTNKGVRCWGRETFQLPTDLGVVDSISMKGSNFCAIKDQQLRCWNRAGKLSHPKNLGPVLQVDAGAFIGCALKIDKSVHCWDLAFGEEIRSPNDLGPFYSVKAGNQYICGLTEKRGMKCWASDMKVTFVPPDFPIPSYEPSKLAWTWKCNLTQINQEETTKKNCNTEDLRIYHTSDMFRVRGWIQCEGSKLPTSWFVHSHIKGDEVFNSREKTSIGIVSNTTYKSTERYGDRIVTHDIVASKDFKQMNYIYDTSNPSTGENPLRIEMKCRK